MLSESSLDYFLSGNIEVSDLKQYYTLDEPLNLSSHDPLTATIRVESEKQNTVEIFSHTYSSFVRKRVDWDMAKLEDYREATDIALTRAAIYWNFPEAIPHLCSLSSNLLVNCADRTMENIW